MCYIVPEIIFACFVLAMYIAYYTLKKNNMKLKENRLFFILALSSALWSFGFFGVFIQTDPEIAYIWRGIGMAGTFAYLISAQLIICQLFQIPKKLRYYFEGFSYLGVILYFFVIQKEQTTYKPSVIGMTYSFNPGIWNTLYTTYSVFIAVNLLSISIYNIKIAKSDLARDLAKKTLDTELVIMMGMVLDTIFPLLGLPAFPGSTISQFLGLLVMQKTVSFLCRSKITIENMTEFIYYSLKSPVLVYDSKQNLKILNDAAFEFFDIDKNSKKYPEFTDLFALVEGSAFDFKAISQDLDVICLNNNTYCTLSINKIFYDKYEDTIGYIIIVTDLSEKIEAIKNLEKAMNEADYANKAKSTFLANMSHEIRTPLNAIIGFSELILRMPTDEQVHKYTEDIKWSSHNLLAIINDILDISKIESGKIELVVSNYYTVNLLNDLKVIIAPQADKKGLDFNFQVDENIPKVLNGDKTRIRGVLINILNNAVKYTHKGSISFKAELLSQNDSNVKLAFSVTDTGCGIKPENIEKLFESFERIDKKVNYGIEGSGLGLSIANGYVTLMGGEIKVESTYKKGSTFTVIIDQEIVDASPIENDYKATMTPSTENIKHLQIKNTPALVVDDNIINLKVADGLLSSYGLKLDTATCGEEAINLCKKNNYDLIFLDQMMPGMDGIETLNEIRGLDYYKENSDVKIIVLTADAVKGARENLLKSGFDEYLGKPINLKQLERVLVNFVPDNRISYVDDEEYKELIAGKGLSGNLPSTISGNISSVTANINTDGDDSLQSTSDIDNEQLKKELAYLKEALPKLSVVEAIERCGGAINDFLNVLLITHSYGLKQLAELEEIWMSLDYKTYVIKIHSMKSTTKNIGADALSNLAAGQEENGRHENYQFIDDNFVKFKVEYIALLEDIKKVLEHYDMLPDEKEETTLPVIDEAYVIPVLKNIERCIEDFEFAKVFDILDQVKRYKLPEKYTDLIFQIDELMQDLCVDEIMELLKDYISD